MDFCHGDGEFICGIRNVGQTVEAARGGLPQTKQSGPDISLFQNPSQLSNQVQGVPRWNSSGAGNSPQSA
jgi:hypothetical protein